MSTTRSALLIVFGFIGCCLTAAVVVLYLLLAAQGVGARQQPSVIEAWISNHMLHLLIPRTAKERKNPLPATEQNTNVGQQYFTQKCAICHGIEGDGQTEMGKGLYPPPPDLRGSGVQKMPDGELFYIIRNGIRNTGMPGLEMTEEQAWQLVIFVRSLARTRQGSGRGSVFIWSGVLPGMAPLPAYQEPLHSLHTALFASTFFPHGH
jgi:mono/diheme cytochrome c family protein